MNIQSKHPTTADEFLRWNEGREGKREFVRGKVVEMMINTTKRHAILALRVGAILLRQFSYPAYSVGSADVAVRTGDGIRYPDVFVDRGTPSSNDSDLVASEPVLLAEVLSPSSMSRDFIEKVADYSAIPSLQHYLILSHEEPRIWLWSRDGADAWLGPDEIVGREEIVDLKRLGATIALAEVYSGIDRGSVQ
ncbi:Uma2 family endonuclease [Arvimicrobium flavum]|uniref:Uma2 family endonuclease n=1 Tax=Arvimicrobium flavum TaxID=3393320 RepID=UPI00237AC777|nr:Uma2 family endonuclease [Mesorhizobium shangrilense]